MTSFALAAARHRSRTAAGSAAFLMAAALPVAPALAKETGDLPPPVATETAGGTREGYTAADFARFAPRNAFDMVNRVPGFAIAAEEQTRGLGQATANVLINGERIASKSEGVVAVLQRITAERVVRIDLVDGATLGIPGLSGQVANVIAKSGGLSGRFEYRSVVRPRFAKPNWAAGEVSLSGSRGALEWSAAFTLDAGRGGAGGGDGALIYDGAGQLIERRDVLITNVNTDPKLSGQLKWTSPGGVLTNFNASYSRSYYHGSDDQARNVLGGVDLFRDFDRKEDGDAHEIGGDVEFALGSGRLKLIGLERADYYAGPSTSVSTYADGRPPTGNRFDQQTRTGERVGRAEYRVDKLGGSWELDGEAAFNRLRQSAQLFTLDPAGSWIELPFPSGTGGVTEDRYELVLNHNRTLARGLSVQVGVGGEYSQLSQTGAGGLTRRFTRPKGSATLAWTPHRGLDLSLKLARTVGQLSFGDFLASVDLAQNNGNAGNIALVPQQAWEADLEVKQSLSAWGSASLQLYARRIDDYIDIVPVNGGESSGNIDGRARLYGVSFDATINLDPLGWKGARIDASGAYEDTSLADPLTGERRPFSNDTYTSGEVSLRYDIPKSDWAMGGGINWNINRPYVRLFEVGREYEGPVYSYAFIENKDVFGLTVNLQAFNLTNGHNFFDRTVWSGLRDRSPVLFTENRKLEVSTIYRLQVKGSF